MKKVLLSSVVALTLFAAAAPVFAQGENAESSNQLIQKKYVSWRDAADEAEKQVNAHDAEIRAEATRQPAVVAAQAALDELKKAQEDNNLDDMKSKLEALNEKAQALAVKLYEQAAAAQQAQAGAEGASQTNTDDNKGDDVVDGEFTEK